MKRIDELWCLRHTYLGKTQHIAPSQFGRKYTQYKLSQAMVLLAHQSGKISTRCTETVWSNNIQYKRLKIGAYHVCLVETVPN